MAYLRPHTALYECAAEHYFAHASGRCEHCHAELATEHVQSCVAGTRLRGCPALDIARECVNCTYGSELVDAGRAHYLENKPGAACRWACNSGYHYDAFLATCQEITSNCQKVLGICFFCIK